MSAEKETVQRVQGALFHLQKGLTPFVEARMKAVHGASWLHYASRASGGSAAAPLDAYGLVKTMIDRWREVFADAFSRNETHKARNFTSMVLEARNAISHLAIGLQDDEALRYLDAMHQLLKLTKAPEKEVAEVKKLYDAQRNSGSARVPVAVPPPVAALDLTDGPAKALKPWIEVALPHPDVIANRFKEAEFAADLFAVDAGHASEGYATPTSFFGITFLTEGLKRVLTSSAQRLADSGGDPVIGLQTTFGGGKTHTMLAIFHLAKYLADGGDPRTLQGLGPVLEKASIAALPKPKLAVFVGSADGPDVSLKLDNGPRVHTVWGYLAWRLAGEKGLAIVAEAEKARTSPGSRALVELFKLAGPTVILLDELTMYARQLDDERFEAFLSFIQSLTEAAKMSPGVLIVGSLPESDAEAGGDRGRAALRRLEQVFGRVQSPWLPASGDETYEIIRRRLFQPLDADGEKARDETIKAFHDLYKRNPAEFPPEAKEARYLELLRLSYPIHPELFERLSKAWASLERFQRTRGVLRFMANVIGVLWHAQTRDPLITPARVPVAHERVRASVLYPLDPAFGAVVDSEVDGDGSLPARMEANPSRRMSQLRAATRSARAVFICTAPLVGRPNAGLTGQGLRLASAEPGDQIAIFGEALRELTERATYLYEEAGRYWFSTQPTLNRLADDRAKALPEHEVDAEIVKLLSEDAKVKGGFNRVFAAPDDPTSIEEAEAISLVIMSPSMTHAGKGVLKSLASDAASDALLRCRASQRRFRNTLLFIAPDESQLGNAREVMRKALAWKSIVEDDRVQQQLTQGQASDTRDKAKSNRESAQKAVRGAWSHILYPVKSDVAGKPFELEHSLISARDRTSIPSVVYDKAKADGIVMEKLGAERLWLALKPIWPEGRPHIGIAEIEEWFASYVYLPKLRDRVVLESAIHDAVAKLDPQFGYADGFDESTGEYRSLIWASAPPIFTSPTALLVDAREVARHRAEVTAPGPTTSDSSSPPSGPSEPGIGPITSPLSSKPHRFYGSVEIDMVRPVKAFDAILNAVVMELQRTPGAKIKLTLEIEAEAPGGFAEGDIGVVRDNSKQLKFKAEIDWVRGLEAAFLASINDKHLVCSTYNCSTISWGGMAEASFQYIGKDQYCAPNVAAKADVVFVHGLGGDPLKTWSITDDNEGFWPHWLALDFPEINVWSAGYDSAPFVAALIGEGSSLHDRSTVLLDFLTGHSLGQRPIIFVTHSLGGLVVKQMLRMCSDSAKPENKAFLGSTRAIVFCGTPHQGAELATAICAILKVLASRHVKELTLRNDNLLELNDWFRNWVSGSTIAVAAYYENKKTFGTQVVNRASANPNIVGCDPVAIDADHIAICKPATHESQLYISMKALILKVTAAALSGPRTAEVPGNLLPAPAITRLPALMIGAIGSSAIQEPGGQVVLAGTYNSMAVDAPAPKPEILVDFEYFTTQAPHDRRPLAQKLQESGRQYEVKEAQRKKERFAMSLHRHNAQASALARYTRLMSDIETRFNRHVWPAIAKGEPETAINDLVQNTIIAPVLASQLVETEDVTASLVESALYYLTGNCHVRWDADKD